MKRWQFLLITALTAGLVLYLMAANDRRDSFVDEMLEENAELMRQLDISREQVRLMTERLGELEEILLNLRKTQDSVSSSLSSRGGGRMELSLTAPSGFQPWHYERVFKGTGLAGLGQALCAAEKETGVNGVVLAAICAHESGWGTSRLAREKNNLAGLGAYDGCEYTAAMTFEGREACVMFLAELLAGRPGSLDEVGRWYASDPAWAAKVAACVKCIVERGNNNAD